MAPLLFGGCAQSGCWGSCEECCNAAENATHLAHWGGSPGASGGDWAMFQRLILAMISTVSGIIGTQRPESGLSWRSARPGPMDGAV